MDGKLRLHSSLLPFVASPPVITRQPVESKFIRGDAGKLFCGVSGDPAPVVTWFKDNGPIPLSKRLEQLDDNSLYFKKVRKRNDDGIYWCVATNSEGNVTSRKAHVTVMCKFLLVISRILKEN